MSTIHEQMKSIRKKINIAEAIERNLDTARQDYADGNYLDCMDAADRVLQLDSSHPEAIDLKKRANDRKDRSKPIGTGGTCKGNATHPTIVVDAEVVSSTENIARNSCTQDTENTNQYGDFLSFLLCLGGIIAVGFLVYLIVVNIQVILTVLKGVFVCALFTACFIAWKLR